MADNSVPNAPLSHHDAIEHRRLIAQRANAIGYETGEVTPTITFATPGDLSHSYADQDGHYWRFGPMVHFNLLVSTTPTFTTASGNLRIEGLPYAAASSPDASIGVVLLGSTGIAFPGSRTFAVCQVSASTDYVEILVGASATTTTTLTATDVTSGTATNAIRVQGVYPIAV